MEHPANLEQTHAILLASHVAADRLDEARQQRGTHGAEVGGQRVEQGDGPDIEAPTLE